ncbi:MAG: ATP-binding protein [Syntrophobacteraceae bacterium]
MDHTLPPLPENAKCRRCAGRGQIRLPSHNTIFCGECFMHFCRTAVSRAMEKFAITPETDILVAVSGGKDSLAVWDILNALGYRTRGLHVTLGIAGFSDASVEAVAEFATSRNLPWAQYSLKELFGWTVEEVRDRTRRNICSVCGTIKRQMLNRLTVREGYRAIVSGHNLDDEAGRLLGNILRNRTRYFEKQYPYLPSTHPRMPAKVKPLYRLESHELRAYCKFASIRPHSASCPLSRGATSHTVKEALDMLEAKMPGTKRDFLFSYLRNRKPPEFDTSELRLCEQCGEPAWLPLCSVCSLKAQLNEVRKKEEKVKEAAGDNQRGER